VQIKVNVAPRLFTSNGAVQFEYLAERPPHGCKRIPVTLFLIFLLLYLTFGADGNISSSCCRCRSQSRRFWLMFFMGFNMSVAVAVGSIALAGVAAETGVVMLIYLDNALTAKSNSGDTKERR